MQDGRNKDWKRTRWERQKAAAEARAAEAREAARERNRELGRTLDQIELCYKQHQPAQIAHCLDMVKL